MAELSALRERATRYAPELLPRIEALWNAGDVQRNDLFKLRQQVQWRQFLRLIGKRQAT